MIQALKSSSIVISVCCIVCSMLSVIAPMGRMKKTVDIVLSVFLLSSMIIPIVSLKGDNKLVNTIRTHILLYTESAISSE